MTSLFSDDNLRKCEEAMKQKIIINRRESSFSVLRQVDEMRRSNRYCDFLVKVGAEEILAHRVILASGSDYFDKMLSHDTKEKRTGMVEMHGVDAECTSICIDHIYGGEVFVPDDKFEEIVHVATLMQLHTLCGAVEATLIERLDMTIFPTCCKIADVYGLESLGLKCLKFFEENLLAISKSTFFVLLDKSFVKKMVKSPHANLSQVERLDALLRWTKYHTNRTEYFMEMIKLIDLSLVRAGYRRRLIETESLVYQDSERLLHFSISLLDSLGVMSESLEHSQIVVFDADSGHLQCFDPRDNSWEKMHKMADEMSRCCFTAVFLHEHIYVLMENKSVYRLKFLDRSAAWERVADMTENHGAFPPAVALSGIIYVVSHCFGCLSNAIEMYDPSCDEWTILTDELSPLDGPAVTSVDESIYIFGGCHGDCFVQTIELFDFDSKLTPIGCMKEGRSSASAVEVGGKILILGGRDDDGGKSSVECLDICTSQCWDVKRMIKPRYLHKAFEIDGTVYAVGGFGTEDSIERYNINTNEWGLVSLPKNLNLDIKESVKITQPLEGTSGTK